MSGPIKFPHPKIELVVRGGWMDDGKYVPPPRAGPTLRIWMVGNKLNATASVASTAEGSCAAEAILKYADIASPQDCFRLALW